MGISNKRSAKVSVSPMIESTNERVLMFVNLWKLLDPQELKKVDKKHKKMENNSNKLIRRIELNIKVIIH
jgi:hypothetical protein